MNKATKEKITIRFTDLDGWLVISTECLSHCYSIDRLALVQAVRLLTESLECKAII